MLEQVLLHSEMLHHVLEQLGLFRRGVNLDCRVDLEVRFKLSTSWKALINTKVLMSLSQTSLKGMQPLGVHGLHPRKRSSLSTFADFDCTAKYIGLLSRESELSINAFDLIR